MHNVIVNGEKADTISVFDRGLQFGDGIFTTAAIDQGQPLLWSDHSGRLKRDSRQLGIEFGAFDVLTENVFSACSKINRGILKIIITRGQSKIGYAYPENIEPDYIIYVLPWPETICPHINVRTCRTRLHNHPQLAGAKHLNRLEHILARAECLPDEQEGILCDTEGNVIEGTSSNVFIVKNGILKTPDLSYYGVSGIMRAQVISLAEQMSINCEVGPVSMDDMKSAEELFFTNCIAGVRPVVKVDGCSYDVGSMTTEILKQCIENRTCIEIN